MKNYEAVRNRMTGKRIGITLLILFACLLPEVSGDVFGQTRRRRRPRVVAPTPTVKAPEAKPQPKTPTQSQAELQPEAKPEPKPEIKPGPVLWRDPGKVENLDFRYGLGGAENLPQAPFTFLEEDVSGTSAKLKVRDAGGREWGVKWGHEVNSEIIAARLAWAAGYFVEASYFVASGKIIGAPKLGRARKYVSADGNFTDARFELKEKGIKKLNQEESWRWDNNPFLGTREFNGLRIMMMLLSNWDSKDQRDTGRGSNTAIFNVKKTGEERYLVTDWGGSMGKWGSYFSREKWDCKGYQKQNSEFITSTKDGRVQFGYSGQRTGDIREGITLGDVKWLIQYIGRISDKQLRDGLGASGATPQETDCFTKAMRERLDQLKRIAEF
jgi:hypothetical protein